MKKKHLESISTRFMILKNQTVKGDTSKHWIMLELNINYKQQLANPTTSTPLKTERIRKRFNTGISISKFKWSSIKGEPKTGLSTDLLKFQNRITNKFNQILDDEKTDINNLDTLDRELIEVLKDFSKNESAKIKSNKISIVKYVDDYIEHRKANNTTRGTIKEFITIKNRLKKFIDEENKDYGLDDINLSFSDSFMKHLNKKNYHPNTTKKTFEILKTVLGYFYNRKDELLIEMTDKFKNPEFGKINEIKSKPIALNDIEIDLIRAIDLKPFKEKKIIELQKEFKKGKYPEHKHKFLLNNIDVLFSTFEKTRKAMLLQLATGLRVSDLFKIKPANKKNGLIIMRPKKTLTMKDDNTIYIPLNAISKQVLEPLHYDSSKLKMGASKYNENIKAFLELIGINEELEHYTYKGNKEPVVEYLPKHQLLTSHNLRDTFISKAVRNKIPIPMILRATGQSSYEVIKKYIDLTDQDLVSEMAALF